MKVGKSGDMVWVRSTALVKLLVIKLLVIKLLASAATAGTAAAANPAAAAPVNRPRRLKAERTAADLPERICLFGVSTLPPAELDVFARLAERLDVHLFLLNPCLHFWTEIRSRREIARQVKDQDPRTLYLETGNSLLASLGKQGKDFLRLLQDYNPDEAQSFEDPGEDSLLHCLHVVHI